MSTADLLLKIFGILDEIILPALAAWALFMMRGWLRQYLKEGNE
jgi:hypothetical protein